MIRCMLCLLVGVAAIASIGESVLAEERPATATRVLDDFESYPDGETVGESAKSKPWKRFGEATMDNLVVTAQEDRVLAGKQSAQYPVNWPARFGMVRYVPETPIDLTQSSAVTVKLRSSNPQTRTKAHLSLTNGKATYESKQAVELAGDETKDLRFALGSEQLTHVDGDAAQSAADVLRAATEIGFKLVSTGQQGYKETILIDDVGIIGAGEPQR